jgi:hypothetical protein
MTITGGGMFVIAPENRRLVAVKADWFAVLSKGGTGRINRRTVSVPTRTPWCSRSFSHASVGPKAAYRSRIMVSARLARPGASCRLLGRARWRDVSPAAPSRQ